MDTAPSFILSAWKSSVIISAGFMLLYTLLLKTQHTLGTYKDKLYCIFVTIHLSVSNVGKKNVAWPKEDSDGALWLFLC